MELDQSHLDAKDDNAQGGATITMNLSTHHGVVMLPWHIPNMSGGSGNSSPTTGQESTDKIESGQSTASACGQLVQQLLYFLAQNTTSNFIQSGKRRFGQTQNQVVGRKPRTGIPESLARKPFQKISLNRAARQPFRDHYAQSGTACLNRFGNCLLT